MGSKWLSSHVFCFESFYRFDNTRIHWRQMMCRAPTIILAFLVGCGRENSTELNMCCLSSISVTCSAVIMLNFLQTKPLKPEFCYLWCDLEVTGTADLTFYRFSVSSNISCQRPRKHSSVKVIMLLKCVKAFRSPIWRRLWLLGNLAQVSKEALCVYS